MDHQTRGMATDSSGKGSTVLLIVLGVVVLLVAVGAVAWLGLDLIAEQVKADIEDNPVIVEHIGRIESIELDLLASGDTPGDDTFVFELKGTKGNGVLTVEVVTVDDEHEEVRSGTLRLARPEKPWTSPRERCDPGRGHGVRERPAVGTPVPTLRPRGSGRQTRGEARAASPHGPRARLP